MTFSNTDLLMTWPEHMHRGAEVERGTCEICKAQNMNEIVTVLLKRIDTLEQRLNGHAAWIKAEAERHASRRTY